MIKHSNLQPVYRYGTFVVVKWFSFFLINFQLKYDGATHTRYMMKVMSEYGVPQCGELACVVSMYFQILRTRIGVGVM